jgi:hypothetical protein
MVHTAEVVAGAGTIMTCPKCLAAIGSLRKPLYQGWNFGLDIVRFEPGQEPDRLEPKAQCRKCGEPYSKMTATLRDGRKTWIHTAFGWLPPGVHGRAGSTGD